MEKYRLPSEGNGRKNAQNDKTIIKRHLHEIRFSYVRKL